MFHLPNLTPEQIVFVVGLLSPLVQFALGKVRSFESTHNWVLSFVIPFVGVVATFLLANADFNRLVPWYAEAYLTSQAWYFAAVKWWKAYGTLVAANKPVQTNTEGQVY
jgi:hypothetical protein